MDKRTIKDLLMIEYICLQNEMILKIFADAFREESLKK